MHLIYVLSKLPVQGRTISSGKKIIMLHKHILTFLFDSDPSTGAVNINDTGSAFTINFEENIKIPRDATNIEFVVKKASVWFVTPNVTEKINNQIRFYYEDPNKLNPYDIAVPTGLYSVETLSNRIQTELSRLGLPNDLIELVIDSAENKIAIRFNYYNTIIDFNVDYSLNELLGFDKREIIGYVGDVTDPPTPNTGPLPFFELGDRSAKFNTIDFYLIQSSLLTNGLYINGNYRGIIAKVDIDVPVNHKIIYDPNQTPHLPANELAGIDISSIEFKILNQKFEEVDMRGEYWNFIFEIHYAASGVSDDILNNEKDILL